MSRREQKRAVQRGLRALTARPGWRPGASSGEAADEALRALQGQARAERVYAEAASCADCGAARTASADPTALCDAHLLEASGI